MCRKFVQSIPHHQTKLPLILATLINVMLIKLSTLWKYVKTDRLGSLHYIRDTNFLMSITFICLVLVKYDIQYLCS